MEEKNQFMQEDFEDWKMRSINEFQKLTKQKKKFKEFIKEHDRQDGLFQDQINGLWGEHALLEAKILEKEQEDFKSCKSEVEEESKLEK